MNLTPRYKGYVGHMDVDAESDLIHGQVVGLRDVVTFQGRTPSEALAAFKDSVDDYLAFCAELNRPPEKAYPGTLVIRSSPELHRAVAELAKGRGESINTVVVEALAEKTGLLRDLAGPLEAKRFTAGKSARRSRRPVKGAARKPVPKVAPAKRVSTKARA